MPLAPVAPGDFPPAERLHVITLASSKTEDHQHPDTSWSLDNIAFEILRDAHHRDMSRSTIGRILSEADLKPHRSVYWLNSHDPDFDAKARNICQLYLDAPTLSRPGPPGPVQRREDRNASPPAEVPHATGQARPPRETRVRVHPPRHPSVADDVLRPHRSGRLEPGTNPHQRRLGPPPGPRSLDLPTFGGRAVKGVESFPGDHPCRVHDERSPASSRSRPSSW